MRLEVAVDPDTTTDARQAETLYRRDITGLIVHDSSDREVCLHRKERQYRWIVGAVLAFKRVEGRNSSTKCQVGGTTKDALPARLGGELGGNTPRSTGVGGTT